MRRSGEIGYGTGRAFARKPAGARNFINPRCAHRSRSPAHRNSSSGGSCGGAISAAGTGPNPAPQQRRPRRYRAKTIQLSALTNARAIIWRKTGRGLRRDLSNG